MSARKKSKKSQVGVELVRRLATEGDRIFSVDRARELAPDVGLKDSYLLEALYHLRCNGWIVSLRRGLYAISSAIPGVAPVNEFEVAMALVKNGAISHWSALHFHGLTEQAPRKIFVLTTTDISIPTNLIFIRSNCACIRLIFTKGGISSVLCINIFKFNISSPT
jgi:predicted transcriptional regulator of viral defense system